MRKARLGLILTVCALSSAGLLLNRATAATPNGPEGAVVNGSGHVCSGASATSPNVGPGSSCTYTIPQTSGYSGQGPFTISYGTTTITCAAGASCTDGSTPPDPLAPGTLPANTAITVSVPAGSSGFVASGSPTGT